METTSGNFFYWQYKTMSDGYSIGIVDRVTSETLTVSFNAPNEIDFQTASHVVTQMIVQFGERYPLTAEELISLIGEPEDVGMGNDLNGFVAGNYALYCALNLRARSSVSVFELASPQDNLASIEIYDSPLVACNGEIKVKWQGFVGNYKQQIQDVYDCQIVGVCSGAIGSMGSTSSSNDER